MDELIAGLAAKPWALVVLAGLVFADAFLVVVPGEVAVTALGTVAVAHGLPPLWAVILTGAAAAFAGDVCCYLVGRLLHPHRWRILQRPTLQRALDGAARRLRTHAATAVFTARFIPFGRLAVNLSAGAAVVPAVRYLPIAAVAALAWAAFQALVGAAIAAIVPGGTVVAVLVSIAIALAVGWTVDVVLAKVRPAS
ncbi:DedA family protein [Microbacterium stercoris]|uniref:VTT domain-containing protein n=1 Tax=Microbacterium stercoris TaxID=2820289 RepID=A0A939TQC6_9MICO|nr:VTT domain-containing protein [Microbacterium stercoris]MBO3663330.1 VTT domain-containing protein [Microbacterium stercoris]